MDKKRILVIDDDKLILKSIQLILGDDYSLAMALDGQEALELLDQEDGQFDLIISDLSMPNVNGANFYLLAIDKYLGIADRIIFMTGGPFGSYIDTFSITNKNPCIQKPFSSEELSRAIENYFADFYNQSEK